MLATSRGKNRLIKDVILSASPWFKSWCNNDLKHEIDNSHNFTQKMYTYHIHIPKIHGTRKWHSIHGDDECMWPVFFHFCE